MHFHSFEFACFLSAVLVFVMTFRVGFVQKLVLIGASLFFYSWDHSHYIWLLVYSTCLDFVLGQKIAAAPQDKKKFYLILSLVGNLGLLMTFKYLGFFNELLLQAGGAWDWQLEILLPIGISFYTFQTMSYSVDIYRGKLEPCRRLGDFALYVSFFPQLIAGPIVRASQFLPQLQRGIKITPTAIALGSELFVLGLFKKSLGDIFYNAHNEIATSSQEYAGLWVLFSIYAYSLHIYLDFSGYSQMAIGLAKMFGLELPENFRFPYLAKSFSDLWRRWHITLSTWMRDYLYIPLGGNRCSKWRQAFNLIVTMALSGLWHGAALNFLLWGLLHGLLLFFERTAIWKWIAKSRALATFFVFNATAFLFLIFSLDKGNLWLFKKFMHQLFQPTAGMLTASMALAGVVMALVLGVHLIAYRDETFAEKWAQKPALRYLALFLAFLIAMVYVEHTANVYFKF